MDVKSLNYVTTYPYFVDYFKSIDQITLNELVISSHFVYGWMPTIVNLNLDSKQSFLKSLNNAKNGQMLSEGELVNGKSCINNSTVGLSKLLHFVNPENYAIWDSRIFRFITGKKSTYGISEPNNYIAYLEFLKCLTRDSLFTKFHAIVNENIGYDVTKIRALELVMFEADKIS